MQSIWTMGFEIEEQAPLNEDISVDVAVIGAGMAGILTAVRLQEKGLKVAVLEADRIAGGVTRGTTAKITSQHYVMYNNLIQTLGFEKAQQYAAANEKAVCEYRDWVGNRKIDCNFENRPAFAYSSDDVSQLMLEAEAAQRLNIDAEFASTTELPFPVVGAVRFNNQAQFHPLKFIAGVIGNLKIYEHTMVRKVDGHEITTDRAKVLAEKIVVATHYPFINVPGYYFIRQHQERSYVLALKNVPKIEGMYIEATGKGYSLRSYGEFLLLGGAGHRTGENSAGGCYNRLRKAAKEFFYNSEEVCCWSAQDCITTDGIPFIGNYSAFTPDLYVATGFKKWGMSNAMAASMILCDLITGVDNPYAAVFDPQRMNLAASAKGLGEEIKQATKGLSRRAFKVPEEKLADLAPGHGGVIEFNDEKLGVYKDENGQAFTVLAKCPHLGCQLEWNPDEKSWDCPCHGSRFDYKGNLLDNPAMEGLEHE